LLASKDENSCNEFTSNIIHNDTIGRKSIEYLGNVNDMEMIDNPTFSNSRVDLENINSYKIN